jgi:protein-L-isoaspartate(D-aspartate) O-methyltransferase
MADSRFATNGQRAPKSTSGGQNFELLRHSMVECQLRKRGIADTRVLDAMMRVPREEFVPAEHRGRAYEDGPLPIGDRQTISQPYIVAAMTAALGLNGSERVLEIGTGCGYQAAVLATLSQELFTIEYRAELAAAAVGHLARLGYANVHVQCGDGSFGLPESAPFDAILVAAAAPATPEPLLAQLAEQGRMILPVGGVENQELLLITRNGAALRMKKMEPCRFVPLIGAYGWREESSS